ncbi:MAG: hypothetical protein RL316_460 [Bacteroidota bacterium]|jgi:hypothetical protein
MNGLDFQDDDYETIQKRLLEKAQLNLLRNAPQDTFDQIAPLIGGGIDLASKLGSYGAKPTEILTGKQIAPGQVTNAEAEVRKIIADRQTRQRQNALDSLSLMKSIEDVVRRKQEAANTAAYRQQNLEMLRDKMEADIRLRGMALGQNQQKIDNTVDQFNKNWENKFKQLGKEQEFKKEERLGTEGYKTLTREDEQEFKAKESALDRELKEKIASAAEKGKTARSASGGGKNQVPGMVYVGEYTPTEKDATEVKKRKAAWEDLDNSLNKLSNSVNKYGIVIRPSPQKSELESAYNDVMIKGKEAANLGAITGPDLQIITSVIPNPSSLKSNLFLNKKDIIEILQNQRKRSYDSFNTISRSYGYSLKEPINLVSHDVGKEKVAPKIGDIIKGYKYIGGNPKEKSSWEKIK